MRRLCVAVICLGASSTAAPSVRAQCETVRFQHYDGAGFTDVLDPSFLNGEEFGIVVDGLPAEHFPVEVTRVGFGQGSAASLQVDVRVFDTWPPPASNPVPTYVHPGVTSQVGINLVDVTPSGPLILAAQPFTVTVQNRTARQVLRGAEDGNGTPCAGGPDSSIYHYVTFPGPGWFGACLDVGDWVFWIEYLPAAVGTTACPGDGSAGDCPCGAAQNGPSGAGCLHSFGDGGVLSAWGKPQVSDDTLALVASGLPASTMALYIQYSSLAPAIAFGDGLLCAGGPVVRLRGTMTQDGVSCIGPSSQPVSVLGHVPPGGGGRYYQVWYRNVSATWCTPDAFNLSSGVSIAWVP